MRSVKRGPKKWWRRAKELMNRKPEPSAIPAFKSLVWRRVTAPKNKANLFAESCAAICILSPEKYHDFSVFTTKEVAPPVDILPVSEEAILTIMEELNEGSAT